MQTYNNTTLDPATIPSFKLLFTVKSKWRQRDISVYEHPTDPDKLVSDGVTFDGSMRVISEECRGCWAYQVKQLPYQQHFVTE